MQVKSKICLALHRNQDSALVVNVFQENVSLKKYNTFGIEAKAAYFADFQSVEELRQLLALPEVQQGPRLILGGGSNMLLLSDFEGFVLHNRITGIELINKDDTFFWVKAGGGVVWHELVMFCVENGYAGMENLSLIPGTVGAAPMQNIGAYGVEIKDIFESLEAVEIATGQVHTFDNLRCRFGYRESVFKHELKGKYVITSVTFRLRKEAILHTTYGAIKEVLARKEITTPDIRAISEAVIEIRRSKLPDPAEIGNAGSFFKNPEIPKSQFEELLKKYPAMPSYPISETTVKVPAGWLIEQAGWKGYRRGQVGVHDKQALVLVNHGGGQGYEIKQLAEDIRVSVNEKFGIVINPEVNFIG